LLPDSVGEMAIANKRELEVLAAVAEKMKEAAVLWDVTQCSLAGRHQCFGRTCSLHPQGKRKIN
jgi:hypothetical protein